MGWLFMPFTSMGGHASAKAYLDAQLTYQRDNDDGTTRGLKVLASSCPGNRVYYAAAQILTNGDPGEVFAVVCLVRWNPRSRDGHQFGYKDMDETMGPCEAECPARILDLLTSTENQHAIEWRQRCRANIARRARKLSDGDRIRLPEPMKFTDGHVAQEFIVSKRGRRMVLRDPETGGLYRVSRLMERAWSIVPVTKIHKTIFA
ncbi:MAG: hypothetical protein AB7L36_15205 [Sphingomonadaceae bacterium]